MRKLMTIMAAFGCALALAACGDRNDQKTDQIAAASRQQAPAASRRTAEQPSPATTTAAPTPTQVATCMTAGLTADNRTQAQARRLPVGTEVTINGAKQRLAAGQSYWSLCSGPSVHERLAAAERQLAEANRALRTLQGQLDTVTVERNTLVPLAYIDPAADRNQDNTWKQVAEQAAGIDWLKWIFLVWAMGMTVIWFVTRRRHQGSKERTGFNTSGLEGVDPRQSQDGDGVVTRN